jgi:hypothetical protein
MTANVRHSTESNEFYTPEPVVTPSRYVLGGIDLDPASSAFANELVRATTYFALDLERFEETNGLLQPAWLGRTFLNCPGGLIDVDGRPVYRKTKTRLGCTETGSCGLPPGHAHQGVNSSAAVWWRTLVGQWVKGNVTAAIFVGFSLELFQSCQEGEAPPHHPLQFPCCLPAKRARFDQVEIVDGVPTRVPGDQPTHSNFITLLPGLDARGEVDQQMLDRFSAAFTPLGYMHRGDDY